MLANTIYVLSRYPLVLMGSQKMIERVPDLPGNFTFLYHNAGFIRLRTLRQYLRARLRCAYRGKRLIVVTNEPSEARWLRLIGVEAQCLGHNLHVREQLYVPLPDVPKRYDAVYAAQLQSFKRLHLAERVKSLYVVTYVTGEQSWDLHAYEPRLQHADFNRGWVRHEDVPRIYNEARVGLALSQREGAMLASLEYLFCGLPVVTTRNRGGRDRYLTPRNSRFVADDPGAVAAAVAAFVNNPPDPLAIRREALEMVQRDRLDYVVMLRKRCGVTFSSPEAEVERIWGGVEGISRLAVPIGEIGRRITEGFGSGL
jgi:glycosyltransferase involved in cell wall biosynthesis